MKIEKIKINSYGKIKEKEINLKNNINIIYGKNESGKSTILNYIKNIFYGISKNKNGKEISDYEKYKPWTGEEFSGKIKYELDNGKSFEIYRDFNKKNVKIFDEDLNEISAQFKIDKKDGNQFFYDQTEIDEKTYVSTIMTMQQHVILDTQSQNALVQRLANLAGTGDDKVSYQKAIERLNKRQLEEVGSSRTQDRPLNLVQKRMKEIELVIKARKNEQEDKHMLEENRKNILEKIKKEKQKNNIIKKINTLIQKNEIDLEKNDVKIKIKNENQEKIKKLNEEKENILKNKKIKNKNKKEKNINLIFLIIFILLIAINIINLKLISNKIINYILISFLPLEIIIYLIYYLKNKLNKNKIKMEEQKIQEKISIINSQIKLLENELQKQINEIAKTEKEIDENKDLEIEKIKKENYELDITDILELQNTKQLQKEIEESNSKIMNYQFELNKLEYEEKNIAEKLEETTILQEEYENLKEKLQIIEEKNKYIQITKQLLENAYEKMRKNVTPKFTQNLSELINEITNGKYKKINISEDKGLIVELENGEYVPANLLSIGTIDELYLALRLSMIDEISSQKIPIILDETFAYFDDERLENSLRFLERKSQDHQIILFTCTKREKQIMEQIGISYNWVEI